MGLKSKKPGCIAATRAASGAVTRYVARISRVEGCEAGSDDAHTAAIRPEQLAVIGAFMLDVPPEGSVGPEAGRKFESANASR